MASTTDWLLQNISRADWWRSKACKQYPNDCALEGGVDIPEKGGTPIYALATGKLTGAGTFVHSNGNPGYGVVTEDIPGIGQVYYQHIDLAPGIPNCKSGNCGGYTVQAGQLIGYSRSNVGEVEVGINPGWGGIWGTLPKPGPWVSDPRNELTALAQHTTPVGPQDTEPAPPTSGNNPITTLCQQLPPSVAFALCGVVPPAQNTLNDALAATGGTCAPWDVQCIMKNILLDIGPLIQKLLLFGLGLAMFGLGVYLLMSKAEEKVSDAVLKVAGPGGSELSSPTPAPQTPPAQQPTPSAPHPAGKNKAKSESKAAKVEKVAQVAKVAAL